VHVVEEAAQVGTSVQALQLLLVQGYHLVDAPFVLELEVSDRTVEGIVAQSALLVQKLPGLAVLRRAKQSIIEAFFQFLQPHRIRLRGALDAAHASAKGYNNEMH
jgi:hypothetical protein